MTEAYQSLQQQLELDRGIPYSPNWSAAADFLQIIVDACLQQKPSLIFECSSGLTTLMLARCCQINGVGRVISLENGAQYAEATRSYLQRYGLQDFASVMDAPLLKQNFDAVAYDWYSVADMPDQLIDMLVIDGPPGFLCKHARYPALPVCYPHLNQQSTIYLDDAARQDEQEIVSLWCDRYPGLSHEYVETERGCSILTLTKP
ncbi:MAG: class I SAM-dependent methyltransferase [Candidatus Thiodiazotropha sp.]